jgi:tetratricopeptide (TPR) repeat protein
MQEENFQQAIDAFEIVPAADRNVTFYLQRALCWSNLGNDVQAKADLATAQTLPGKRDAWETRDIDRALGTIERPPGERSIYTAWFIHATDRTRKLIDAALRNRPANAKLLMLRAQTHDWEETDKIRADLDEAIRCDPTNPLPYLQRGIAEQVIYVLANERQVRDRAIADFSSAIRLKPSPHAYALRADAYLRLHAFQNAADDITAFLECSAADAGIRAAALVSRGILRRRLGDDPGARTDLMNATRVKPGMVDSPMTAFSGISSDELVKMTVFDYWYVVRYASVVAVLDQRREPPVDAHAHTE